MAINTADILAKVRQRKKQLQAWETWDTTAGTQIFRPVHTTEHAPPTPTPHLTPAEKKRQKKLDRLEVQEEQRKRIKLGLDSPPDPKLKVSNVHRVFGAAYSKDPTKYELMAAEAEEQRRAEHLKQNEERKLNSDQRWEKHVEKMKAHRQNGISCLAVTCPQLGSKEQYIVDYTAKKFLLTGVLLLDDKVTKLILEGGEPEVLKCEKLLLKKLNFALIWKGFEPEASFKRWSIHSTPDQNSFLKTFGMDTIFDAVDD